MKRLIIRADDLGYSEGVNYGIAKTVREGIVKNVGLMVNMPSSLHGWELLRDADICLGQHACISAGKPVTEPEKIPSLTGPDGYFKASSGYRRAEQDFVVLEEAVIKAEAQYRRFREITGRDPAYFEGHAVMSRNFFKALQIVARRHGLDYLGLSRTEPIRFREQTLYMHIESSSPDYDPFETLKRICMETHEDSFEVLVFHPGYLDDQILKSSSLTIPRTREAAVCCADETKQWLRENGVRLYRFDEL